MPPQDHEGFEAGCRIHRTEGDDRIFCSQRPSFDLKSMIQYNTPYLVFVPTADGSVLCPPIKIGYTVQFTDHGSAGTDDS